MAGPVSSRGVTPQLIRGAALLFPPPRSRANMARAFAPGLTCPKCLKNAAIGPAGTIRSARELHSPTHFGRFGRLIGLIGSTKHDESRKLLAQGGQSRCRRRGTGGDANRPGASRRVEPPWQLEQWPWQWQWQWRMEQRPRQRRLEWRLEPWLA